MQDLVTTLVHLHPHALHARAGEAARSQAGAAWELAACLVAMERSESFRAFDCASVLEYAERQLGLGTCKALELLRGGRVLERFPRLSAACRDGRLCWSKLRELARAVQPGTEEWWLAFAVAHSTREVERAVAVSAAQYRREQAGAAEQTLPAATRERSEQPCRDVAIAEQPLPGSDAGSATTQGTFGTHGSAGLESERPGGPTQLACATSSATAVATIGREATAAASAAGATTKPAAPLVSSPAPRALIKVDLYLTPDQFAIWDTAVDRVRSEKGRRVAKEIALEALARHYLAGGDARTRANHPVVLRADPVSGSTWYETSRGVLPASPEAVEDALARERGTFVAVADAPADQPSSGSTAASAKGAGPAAITEDAGPTATAEDAGPTASAEDAAADGGLPAQNEVFSHPESGSGTSASNEPSPGPRPAGARRKPIPAARRRAALARANYRCERCGATTRLEVDHVTAVCDGGADLALQVLCHDCHAHRHAEDSAGDPRYIRGRAGGIARRECRTGNTAVAETPPVESG